MTCETCGAATIKRAVTKHHSLDVKLYVVENVEAEVCPECGTRYYHATVLDAVDAFLRSDHPVRRRLEVEVVSL